MEQVLRVDNISKTYQALNGEVEAIKNVTFDVKLRRICQYNRPKWMW